MRASELHAIVLGRIMRSRDHDAAVQLERPHGKIERIGGNHSDVHDVRSGFGRSTSKCAGEFLPRRAHVAADGDGCATLARRRSPGEQWDEAASDGICHFIAELGRINPADVVGFENRGIHLDAHSPSFFDCAFLTPL
jgi:hypothetical protein